MAKTTDRKITDYTPDPANANKGTERGAYMVEESLQQTGAGRSIVVDKHGVIIAGNKTQQAALDSGIVEVVEVETDGNQLVVVRRNDLDLANGDERARLLAYYDNRAGQVGLEWDADQLLADMEAGLDLDGMFSTDELADILGDMWQPEQAEDPGPQVDRAEELREKWQTERGQVWEIGRHRLMCGDSTSEADVARLVDGERAALLLTDPPYGINVVQVAGATVGGSKPVTIGTVRHRKTDTVGGVENRGTDGATNMVDATPYRPVHGDDKPFDPRPLLDMADNQIIFGGNYFASKLPDSRCWIVWDKNNTGNFADAELAWTSFETGVRLYRFTWNGLVREGSRELEGVKRMHPTQKPAGLFSDILIDYSEQEDIILDLYLGSGTTLVACEHSGRRGRGMELDEAYCAVTLERLAGMGLEPRLAE